MSMAAMTFLHGDEELRILSKINIVKTYIFTNKNNVNKPLCMPCTM
jgi:hypothetical protein